MEDVNRLVQRELFGSALNQYELWKRVSFEDRAKIVRRMERSCHNHAISACTLAFIPCRWDEPRFIQRYSTICYKILSNIDRTTAPSRSAFAIQIITGGIDARDVCDVTSYDMCPSASKHVHDELYVQMQQHVDEKFTKDICKKCGAQTIVRVQAQTRAADEISSFHYKCKSCNSTWGK